MLMNFNVNDIVVECNEYVKLLGVTFDTKLKFDKHIDNICNKASRQINALARLSRKLDYESKIAIFNSFIKSNFNYCPLVWMCCGKRNVDRIEKLQCRAVRFVCNDFVSNYECLLDRCGMKPLHVERLQKLALEVFKCVHKICPSYMNDMFEVMDLQYDLRDPYPVRQKPFKTITYGYRSFSYLGSKLWNMLPNCVKQDTDYNSFKRQLQTWEGPCTNDRWF